MSAKNEENPSEESAPEKVSKNAFDDEEEVDRPEWDDEKWLAAKADEEKTSNEAVDVTAKIEADDVQGAEDEKVDRPEWDDEKWLAAKAGEEKSTDEAIDSIIKKEADTVLSAEDKKIADAFDGMSPVEKVKSFFSSVWNNPTQRNSSIAGVTLALIMLMAIPVSRFTILNTVGVRASAHIVVLDTDTQTPLKNVEVSIGGQEALTDKQGRAVLDNIRLGKQSLTVIKSAYDQYNQTVTISTGSNTFENVMLLPVGAQFNYEVHDWLSLKPLEEAEATYGESDAAANEEGEITLTIPPTDESSIETTVGADGYSDQKVLVDTLNKETNRVGLVVDRPHYFVSERDGRYDIYRSEADGSGQQLLVQGTGQERDDIRFTVSPDRTKAILVASRDGNMNEEGYLMRGLYEVDLETAAIVKVDESERFDLAGWIDESIIYIKVQAGASGRNPERHRLVGYNSLTGVTSQIAASNYFNDVLVAQDYVFYAPSDAYKASPTPYLFRANATGTVNTTVYDQVVWTLLRTDYDTVSFYTGEQEWFSTNVRNLFPSKQESGPIDQVSRLYTSNPADRKTLWVDQRDGKGVLVEYDIDTRTENVLWRQAGLRNPIRWLSDIHLVFRVVTDTETADYILNLEGGEPVKVLDVSDISGYDRYYYYY